MKRTKRARSQIKSLRRTVEYPSQNDVVLGLNANFPQNIHGNQYLKKMIDVNRERYSLSKSSIEKEGIAITVLQKLIELKPRGRILKSTVDGKYIEQDESNSLEIIKQLFQKPPKKARGNDKAASNLPAAKKKIQSTATHQNPPRRQQDHGRGSSRTRTTRTTMAIKPNETTSLDLSSSNSRITNADMSHVLNLLIDNPPSPIKKSSGGGGSST